MVDIYILQGKLVKGGRSDISKGIEDARDAQTKFMSVEAAIEAHKELHGKFNNRLNIWMATETPRGADEAGFAAIGKASEQHNIRLTMHLAEALEDRKMIQQSYGCTPMQFAKRVDAAASHVVLGHMVHVDLDMDLDILKESKAHVAHNPTSNAKLGDGIAPIPAFLSRGINVCLGSDGAPCNNGHDLFRDMHLAGIIHKANSLDASVLPAEQVLEMATINGARALGLEQSIGSLEVGKKADFVIVNPHGIHTVPYDSSSVGRGGMNPTTVVVHSCSSRDIDMVVVDGQCLVKGGKFTHLNEEELILSAQVAIGNLRQKSGVLAQPLKNNWCYC